MVTFKFAMALEDPLEVLVTDGDSVIGHALKQLKPDWTYLPIDASELVSYSNFTDYLSTRRFDAVIHNATYHSMGQTRAGHNIVEFEENLQLNLNVVRACRCSGIKRLICCLDSCAFQPKTAEELVLETEFHNGKPRVEQAGAAYATRIIDTHCNLLNSCDSDFRYQCVIPCQVYGPNDLFEEDSTSIVASLIKSAYLAALSDEDKLVLNYPSEKRIQLIYAVDVAHLLITTIEEDESYGDDGRLLFAPNQKTQIKYLAKLIAQQFGLKYIAKDVSSPDSPVLHNQSQTILSNTRLIELFGEDTEDDITDIEDGVKLTCEWFKRHLGAGLEPSSDEDYEHNNGFEQHEIRFSLEHHDPV